MSYTATLPGPPPWGFRLQGGKDFNTPLTISRVNSESKAASANMSPSDTVLQIDGVSTDGMTHLEAQTRIKNCVGSLKLSLHRSKHPGLVGIAHMDPAQVVIPHQQITESGTSNFNPGILKDTATATHKPIEVKGLGGKSTIVHAQYNTPISIYSQDAIMDAIAGQAHAVGSDTPGIQVKECAVDTTSKVYQAVVKSDTKRQMGEDVNDWMQRSGTAQSRSFQILAHLTGTEYLQDPDEEALTKARDQAQHQPAANQPAPSAAATTHTAAYSANQQVSSSSSWQQSATSTFTHSAASQSHASHHEMHVAAPQAASHTAPAQRHATALSKPSVVTTATIRPSVPPSGQLGSSVQVTIAKPGPTCPAPAPNDTADRPPWVTDTNFAQKYAADQSTTTLTKHISPSHGPSHLASPAHPPAHAPVQSPSHPTSHIPAYAPIHPASQNPTRATAPSPSTGYSCPSGPVPSQAHGQVLPPSASPSRSKVQWAQHFQAGSRTPMCGNCNQIIRGPFLVALSRSWHPNEFKCSHCNSTLSDVGFVEEQGSVYCESCYEKYLAPNCARCSKKIMGEVMHALRQTWHTACFVCAACGQPFGNSLFHMEDGEPYCEKDYVALFSTKCHGCDFPVEAGDKFIEALGYTWHDTCFICAVCHVNLEGQPFFSKKDKPLCKKHAHAINI
uniref:LIM domain-binding protein 3 isoform X2 n=1 Tax=Myxine glutinosa TaxID=7769 RepID=UPI00358FBB41